MGQSWSRKWLCSLMMNQFSQLGSTVYSLSVWWSDLMLPSGTHGHIKSATVWRKQEGGLNYQNKIQGQRKDADIQTNHQCSFPLNMSRHRTSTRRVVQRVTATVWFCVHKYPQTSTERVVDRTCPVRTVLTMSLLQKYAGIIMNIYFKY